MKYPSYPGMTDEELIKYIEQWWRTASVKELIKRYKDLEKRHSDAQWSLTEYRDRGY